MFLSCTCFWWFARCTKHWSCQVCKVFYSLPLPSPWFASFWVPFPFFLSFFFPFLGLPSSLSSLPRSCVLVLSSLSFPFFSLFFPFLSLLFRLSPSFLPSFFFPSPVLSFPSFSFLFSSPLFPLPLSFFAFFSAFLSLPSWFSLLPPSLVFVGFLVLSLLLCFVVLEVSNLLSLPLLAVKLWIDLVLLTDLLLQWLVPDLWSTFLCGVVPILQTTIQEVQAFHQVRLLHFSGPKALEDFNLLKDYLWLRIHSRFLQDKLANPNNLWAYHSRVATLLKLKDGAQDMALPLLLDLKYTVLDWVAWYLLFLLLHPRGPLLSSLDNSMAIFDLHIMDQVLHHPRDLPRLLHQVDRIQEPLTHLANNHWEGSQTYLWDNIGSLMKNTMIPRSWMDWHCLEPSDLQVGPNWRTLKVVIRLQSPWVSYYTKAVRISGFANWLQVEKSMLQQWEKLARLSLWVKYYLNFEVVELTLTNWHSTRLFKMAMHWRKEKLSKVWQNRLETNYNDGPLPLKLIQALSTRLLSWKPGWLHCKLLPTNLQLLLVSKHKYQLKHLKLLVLHREYNPPLKQLSKVKDLQYLTQLNCWLALAAIINGWKTTWLIPSVTRNTNPGSKTWSLTTPPDKPLKETLWQWIIGGKTNQKKQKPLFIVLPFALEFLQPRSNQDRMRTYWRSLQWPSLWLLDYVPC